MKTKLFLCSILLLAGLTLNSCKPSDEKLQKEVSTLISAIPSVTPVVKDGVVTLSGVVETEEIKAEAEKLAGSAKGIKSVTNNIEIQQPEPEISPDEALMNTITSAISGKGAKFKDVTVSVKDGEVTLTGIVNKADLQELMQIANEANPKKVNNVLNIRK